VLFPKGPASQFELTGSTILADGMAILTYRVASTRELASQPVACRLRA
jgi:hypothetical protein